MWKYLEYCGGLHYCGGYHEYQEGCPACGLESRVAKMVDRQSSFENLGYFSDIEASPGRLLGNQYIRGRSFDTFGSKFFSRVLYFCFCPCPVL